FLVEPILLNRSRGKDLVCQGFALEEKNAFTRERVFWTGLGFVLKSEGVKWQRVCWVTLFLFLLALWFTQDKSLGQLADRAVITGVVTDASGAAVPDARVTITDQGTGVQTVVGSNSAGNYATPPLILGTYKVTVEKTGFKTFSREGIVL